MLTPLAAGNGLCQRSEGGYGFGRDLDRAAALPGKENTNVQADHHVQAFVAGVYNVGAAVMVVASLAMLAGRQRSEG
nr:hypothetical protein [uncultured Pseudomonas sp.]